MNSAELMRLDATDQAVLVRSGQVSPTELVVAAIKRIEEHRELNSVVHDLFDRALTQAAGPAGSGPFAGVPFLLKDLGASLAGTPESMGSRAIHGYVAHSTQTTVQRYLNAGLIVCGKTNTPEFGNHCATEPSLFGPTRNPWTADRTCGGSSGGSAVAVAAGLVAAASGGDATGSIRVPSSCCGVVGLKPRRNRKSAAPGPDVLGGLVSEHVLTRSVRDSAALLDATAGPALGDPNCLPAPPAGSFLAAATGPKPRTRVLLASGPPYPGEVDPRVADVVNTVAVELEKLGHDVDSGAPTFDTDAARRAISVLHQVENVHSFRFATQLLGRVPARDEFEPVTWDMIREGLTCSGEDYANAITTLHTEGRRVGTVFEKADVLLCPTLNVLPPEHGHLTRSHGTTEQFFANEFSVTGWTSVANLAGWAAISLPLGEVDGLPVGVQLMAPDEHILLALGAQLEEVMPWTHRTYGE